MRILPLYSTDAELVAACQRGKASAQEVVYQQYSRRMFGLCMRYAASREEAEDILQDGFVKVFAKITQYQHTGSFEGWIRRIILNTAIEYYRRRVRTPLQEELCYAEEAPYANWQLESLDMDALVRQIQALPDGCRAVFNLFEVEGYSHKEIAEMLGISEGTSRSQLNYAKRKLQAYLRGVSIQTHSNRQADGNP
ncbi:MAG: RNA polymerase sigma factor [Bacteroidetes bacterium]|nr:RNA polymerase sigma factor [Bacteroidota bacterium]